MNPHSLGVKSLIKPPIQNIPSIPLGGKIILVVGPHSGFGSQIVNELQSAGAHGITLERLIYEVLN